MTRNPHVKTIPIPSLARLVATASLLTLAACATPVERSTAAHPGEAWEQCRHCAEVSTERQK